MKKEYLQPQVLKYDSLLEITLMLTSEMDPACIQNPGSGCSGSCEDPHGIRYKQSDALCP